MKFCSKCGQEVNEEAVICIHCGCSVETATPEATPQKKLNVFALVGFIVSLASLLIDFGGIVGLVGLIFSSIALRQLKTDGKKGKGFAITGLVVGIISIIYGIYSLAVLMSLIESLGI